MTSASDRVLNFNAGPATLPLSVLEQVQVELLNYAGSGMSVLEMSHRSAQFQAVIDRAEALVRELLNVPGNDQYSVLFMQGGGLTQFSAVPLNLLGEHAAADYVVTGGWSEKAAKEAARYCDVNVVTRCGSGGDGGDGGGGYTSIPPASEWKLSAPGEAAYVYFCANETVHGVEFHEVPEVPEHVTLVADYSSSFMSAPLDISKFGLVFAGAQKNVGPAGVTIVIVRNDLLGRAKPFCPTMLNYATIAKGKSLVNTPPAFSIYVTGLVFQWLQDEMGGLEEVAKRNAAKARIVYAALDKHPEVYLAIVDVPARSRMNVVFNVGQGGKPDKELETKFVAQAAERGLVGLKGHRSLGGIRASIYNSMTREGCEALTQFMDEFASGVLESE